MRTACAGEVNDSAKASSSEPTRRRSGLPDASETAIDSLLRGDTTAHMSDLLSDIINDSEGLDFVDASGRLRRLDSMDNSPA